MLNDGALAVARYMGAVLVCITLEPHRRPASQQTSLLATGDQDRQWTSSCSSLRHSNATSISTRVQNPSPRWTAAESTPSHGILILGRVPVPSRSWARQQEPKSRDVSFMVVMKSKCRCIRVVFCCWPAAQHGQYLEGAPHHLHQRPRHGCPRAVRKESA